MIDPLICDCDGVLVDSEVIADRVMLNLLTLMFPGIEFAPVMHMAFDQQTSTFLASPKQRFGIVMPERFVDTIEAHVSRELSLSVSPIAGVRAALE